MREIRENVPLAPLTTFKIGGSARYFVEAKTEDDVREALHWSDDFDLRPVILGGGSNVLVPDEGVENLVIHIACDRCSFAGLELEADAGCVLLKLIHESGKRGLGGWENLAGVPGSVGGAVRGNAGAFGSEIKDFVHKVRAINMHTGETKEFDNAECGFQYRSSIFKLHPKWLITRAYFHLQKIMPSESAKRAADTILQREKRHLQNVRAAGSYFMNPVVSADLVAIFEKEKNVKSRENRVPAGWLIEKAGMKGISIGGAIASPQHPNYIVNKDNATAADVLALAENIKIAVMSQFGVALHEEAAVL